ncbi:hypothetical protein DITRI_Ditri12bG0055200 [Diplodiscus trichospermus]
MAHQIIVLALVLIALVGLVSADTTTPKSGTEASPSYKGGVEAAAAPSDDDAIGNTNDAGAPSNSSGGDHKSGVTIKGPLGSEDAAKSAPSAAQPPSSDATTRRVSDVTGSIGQQLSLLATSSSSFGVREDVITCFLFVP